MKEAVYRHYYKKLKKLLRLSADKKNHRILLPGNELYDNAIPGGVLYRGQSHSQTDSLLNSGSTKSNQSMNFKKDEFPDSTFATSQLRLANQYGIRGKQGRPQGDILAFHPQSVPVSAGAYGSVAFKNPIKKDELRSILVQDPRKPKWAQFRPLSLGEAKERGFSAKLRLREFSALRKRIRVKWHPDGSARMTIRDQHGGFNEIGRIETTDSSIVDWQKQKLATRGQIKHARIDPKFRGMGLATKMYGEAMKQAPRGRLVSDNAQFDGGYAIWNRLQRNKGYKIRENPKADGAEDGFLSRDKRPLFIGRINPAARKQNNLSAKLRLRELARGDFAIPAVEAILGRKLGDHRGHREHGGGEMKEFASALRSRLVVSVVPASMGGSRIYDATLAGKRVGSISVHDRFARDLFGNITGKKTPKISRSNVDEQFRGMGIGKKLYSEVIKNEGRVMSDSSVSGEARRVYESLKKNKNIKIRTFPAAETPGGLVGRNGVYEQRPPGLSNGFGGRPVFAVQWKGRKGRAGGDVYEEVNRS